MAPLRLIKGTVLNRQMVTPGMVRVTLGGDDIKALKTTGVGDEYVRLFFPDPETGELVLPDVDEKGFWKYPEGKKPAHCECYTIRYFRDGEIDLDFVVHEHGRASEWAQAAEPGDEIVIREPYGIYEAPADADWQLFVCDATGLPALGRLLEGLGENVEARVIVEVPDASHEQAFESKANLKLVWLHGAGNGIAPSQLEAAVRGITFPADRSVYVWVASEAKAVRPIRKYLRHELKWPATRYSITGYWTDKLTEWEKGWEALDPTIKKRIDDLWRSDRDPQDVRDEVEAVMEKFGL
ncbi:siderophore-interacting protein [Devosia sp. ZB163]|uniref:siderophore-interacting protein n=1 Tax=Devosia sp. ZB163 TaxID=3025938 RepID=UPI0023617A69|nr:siderophore-interacting protein [Devosia sp. ZB163]MDC9824890.1 siderophore-interacting protein [Devosia sp. ZB163]